jgi:4,5-dihydroxyphthalate decarboxylase
VDEVHKKVMAISGDPLPYGIEPNRHVLEELIGHAVTQRIVPKRFDVEELFAPGTYALKA